MSPFKPNFNIPQLVSPPPSPTQVAPSSIELHGVPPITVEANMAELNGVELLWHNLKAHILENFYNPDIGALEIALSAAVSHYHKDADPAWLFIIGPSSGDKTSIIINCLLALEQTYQMGDLTTKTFLSGYTGNPNASLLIQIGSGILVFKDFTTFISKKADDQAEIASQLREIYDGYFIKHTGKGMSTPWFGKMTVIAAATPALERYWGTLGDLGERFVQVRIARKSGIQQAEYAQRQAGKELFIKDHMRELAKLLFRSTPPITYPPPTLSSQQCHIVSCLAEIIAHSRGKVPRNIKDEIIGIAEVENSSRASKELNSLVSGHAALFRRQTVDNTMDMWVAQRVALNSIPMARYLVLRAISSNINGVSTSELCRLTGMPLSSIRRTLADLIALHMIVTLECHPEDTHRLTEEIAEIWVQAFPVT